MARRNESPTGHIAIGIFMLGLAVVSLVVFGSDLSETSRRGIPMWVLIPLLVALGVLVLVRGLRLRRRRG